MLIRGTAVVILSTHIVEDVRELPGDGCESAELDREHAYFVARQDG